MRIRRSICRWKFWLSLSSLELTLLIIGLPKLGETSPPPALLAGPLTNGFLSLTVTNGTNNEFYEIYGAPTVDSTNWSLVATGAVSVTNFAVPTYAALMGFFKARAGNDWDNDNILNFQDANPNDPNVGVLYITIDSPTNGTTLR